jgi:hypothetical protein
VKSSDTGKSYTFNIFCAANFAAGQDSGNRNTTTLNNCMQTCVDLRDLGGTCVGVVWDAAMDLAIHPPHNCFLKAARGKIGYSTKADTSASALIED